MAQNHMLNNMSDTEPSDSSDTGSELTSSDSEQLDQSLEPTRILNEILELPKGLCDDPKIFNEFFSLDTWNCLPDHMKDQLNGFLPDFTEVCANDAEAEQETEKTVEQLFTNQITRFHASPLVDFQRNLEEGNYHPDISRLRSNIQRSQRREQRFQQCERVSQMAKSLAVSRERLLRVAYQETGLSGIQKEARMNTSVRPLTTTATASRAKKRYLEEMHAILQDVGLDDDELTDDDGLYESPQPSQSKKSKRSEKQSAHGGSEPKIISTMAVDGFSSMSNHVSLFDNPNAENHLRELLQQHKSRKTDEPDHMELDTSDIKISDIYSRTHNTPGRKPSAKNASNATNPAAAELPVVKADPELPLDHSVADLLPPVNTSFDVPSLDTTHINLSSQFCLSNNSLLDNGPIDEPSIEMNMKHPEHDIDAIKHEIKDEDKIETDVCKQFLKDEDFQPIDSSDQLLFGNKSETLPQALVNSTNIEASLFGKDDDQVVEEEIMSSTMMDTKFDESMIALVPISSSELNLASITADIKHENTLANEKLNKHDLDNISFHSKALKPESFADLDTIDIMRLPVDLVDPSNIDLSLDDIVVNMKPDLLQETHSCFLSVIRDVFCCTPEHRTSLENLSSKITAWMGNPITALNDWYGLVDNWLDTLPTAIHFLAGEFANQPSDFVPYVEYKSHLNSYQWIGAGRDSDQHLKQLCEYWLTRRNDIRITPPKIKNKNSVLNSSTPGINAQLLDENSSNAMDPSLPTPRCPTNWIVRRETDEEIADFRRQEKTRFENPHQAFTYHMHGFESAVGPVKGIYTHMPAMAKARGHTMLTDQRPHYVTILTLVRDATARLPNGEGTRAEICELLKSSQYMNQNAADQVLQTIVSGALDRMHADNDPCVRYDQKRKIWIYLHRNRSEVELERAHKESQNVAKPKKKSTRKSKAKVDESSALEAANQMGIILTNVPGSMTPKTKRAKLQQSPVVVIVSSGPQTPTISNVIPATVKISQPSILTSMNTLPIPALSTIQPSLLATNPPPLVNKINVAQRKGIVQPELVPIQQFFDGKIDGIDTNINKAPIMISKSPIMKTQTQLPGIILEQNPAMGNKIIVKQRIGVASPAPKPVVGKAVSPVTMQAVHVPARAAENLSPTGNQKRRVQQVKTMPPLVAAQSTTNNPSYVIPISLSGRSIASVNKSFQPVVVQTTAAKNVVSPNTIKATTLPVLSTAVPRVTSMVQTQPPQIVSLGGKTMVRTIVSSAATGASPTMQFIQAKPVQQQSQKLPQQQLQLQQVQQVQQVQKTQQPQQHKIIVAGANVIGNAGNKATIVGTTQTGTPIVVQKIISVSKSPATSATNVIATTSPSTAGTTSPSLLLSKTPPPGTSLINPHMLPKVQTISTANLSPLQQQTLFQTLNKHIRLQPGQQQSLIIKPQVFTSSATIKARPTIKTVTNMKQPTATSYTVAATTTISTPATTSILTSSSSSVLTAMSSTANPSPTNVRTVVSAASPRQIISLENLIQSKQIAMPALVAAQSSANQSYVIPISLSGKTITNKTIQPLVISQSRLMAQPTTSIATVKPTTSIANVAVVSGFKQTATIATISSSNATGKQDVLKFATAPTATIVQRTSSAGPQLMNAKVIGVPANQRIKPGGNIRMVNASNLNFANLGSIANIANIDGKSVLITSKIQSPTQQLNTSQQQATTPTNRPNIVFRQQGNSTISPQAVMFGNQIVKINTSNAGSTASRVVLTSTGQPIKIHTPNIITTSPTVRPNMMKGTNITASPGQRVVFVQGAGPILLPANFQGNTINLKQMQGGQGIKMIPVQTSQIQSTMNVQTISQAQVITPSLPTSDDN